MEKKTRGRGRPTLPDDERRSDRFVIRVSSAEKTILESAHENPSTWARELLLKYAAKQGTIK